MKTQAEIDAEKALKSRPDLIPTRAILAGGRAFAYGANKHGLGQTGRGTYRDAGTEQAQVATHRASFLRHWCAYWAGELIDPESGLSHLDCMQAQLSIIIDLIEDPPGPQIVSETVETTAENPADPWALPAGWCWENWDTNGEWDARDGRGYYVYAYGPFGNCRVKSSVNAPPEVVALVRRRNGLDP